MRKIIYQLMFILFFSINVNESIAKDSDGSMFKLSYWKQKQNFDKTGFVYANSDGEGAKLVYNASNYFYLTAETLNLDFVYLIDYDFNEITGVVSRAEVNIRQRLYGVGFQYSFFDNYKVYVEFNDLENEINSYGQEVLYGERSEVGFSYSPIEKLELLLAYSKQSLDHHSTDTFITEVSYQIKYGLGVFYQYRDSEQDSSSTRIGINYRF